jgi:hypothetical protein
VKKALGRKRIVETLASLACRGDTVLVYGPLGIGKTAILAAVARKVKASGKPYEVWPKTETFRDVVLGLAETYPEVQVYGWNHRQLRNAFRLAIEAEPGILLLDHFAGVGTAMKGFLRYLRLSGLGILIAAEVEHPRDHARLRDMRLTHCEVEVPPLPAPYLRVLFEDALRRTTLPHPLDEEALVVHIEKARGRPGWIPRILRRLSDPRYWSGGKALADLIEIDVAIECSGTAPRLGPMV